jgi:DNA processing protein
MERHVDAVAVISLLGLKGVGPAKFHKIAAWARQRRLSLSEAVRAPLQLGALLSAEQIEELPKALDRAQQLADRVAEMGATLVPITDARYPALLSERLGQGAPPLLSVLGEARILETSGVGFCGSRAASEKGLATAQDCAEQLAAVGLAIVSGYAAGVDMAAHGAALRAGGHTTIVLAEGILHFSVKQDLKELWDAKRVVVVSEFLPDTPWRVHNAMRRNRTICGLSRAMILIEARANGGSMEAGKASLELGVPLFAPVYEGMPESAEGNRRLAEVGARPLLRSRSTGRANVAPVVSAVQSSSRVHVPAS